MIDFLMPCVYTIIETLHDACDLYDDGDICL